MLAKGPISSDAVSAPARILPERYDPAPVESKWQGLWEREEAFRAEPVSRDGEAPDDARRGEVVRARDAPVPLGRLHMGHVKNYTMGDVVAHIAGARGVDVLHPMG